MTSAGQAIGRGTTPLHTGQEKYRAGAVLLRSGARPNVAIVERHFLQDGSRSFYDAKQCLVHRRAQIDMLVQ